jgi:putative tryptophan/tyrosine transport system substrate-binding protein
MGLNRMKRRDFIILLSAGTAAWSSDALAQPSSLPTIGILGSGSRNGAAPYLAALQGGMRELGYVEGRNITVIDLWADRRVGELDMHANELVRRQVKLIVASGGLISARAAIKATTTIPVLFIGGFDPVELGLVRSLNKPGGNATGATLFSTELLQKQLELLYGLGPGIRTVGILLDPQSVTPDIEAKQAMEAAERKSFEVRLFNASTANEIDSVFETAAVEQVSAFLVTGSPFFSRRRDQIVALAVRYSTPIIYPWRDYVDAGGLMSYGTELTWAYNVVGQYAGRILKGEKPNDLPVQQPTKFNLIINLKAAKVLGLDLAKTAPQLIALADEVIEE